jgi:hypothetical protein
MEIVLSKIEKIKKHLELVAFLVSKQGSEMAAHAKIVECLVIISQLENIIKGKTATSFPESKSNPQSKNRTINPNKNNEKIDFEVQKVTRRIPKWFRNPSQVNSTILLSYLKLLERNQKVSIQMLRNECNSMLDFNGNYNQMKNFGEKNHGKVFEEIDGHITIWEPVRDCILDFYKKYKL